MRRPAVFFDRDNTLIVCDGYLGDPSKVVLVNGAADSIARCRQLGYAVVVFSNQSGVARGLFTEESVHAVNARLDELLAESNAAAIIDRHEFCPFHPEGSVPQYAKESPLRKPAPGMILQAAEKLALDLTRSWVIGDAPRDIEAGKTAGCRTILFQHPNLQPSAAQAAATKVLPDHFVQSLQAAVNIIAQAANSDDSSDTQPVHPDPAPSEAPNQLPISPPAPVDLSRLEKSLNQILDELKKPQERAVRPFSMTKMFAGVMQIFTLVVLVWTYQSNHLLLAIMLQLFTIALLIMDRQD